MEQIPLKTKQEIAIMREGGVILAKIVEELLSLARPGVATKAIESRAAELVEMYGVESSFKGFEGYLFNAVICVNEEVVHGMPSERVLAVHDLVTIDFGVFHKGFHTDHARTVEVLEENTTANYSDFLRAGEQALEGAIAQARVGNHIGDISNVIETTIEEYGYSVVWQFVGHGVGRNLHEDPQVPGYGDPKEGEVIQEGMVLAVEVMYTEGNPEVTILEDGWTAVTLDGGNSGMFEHSVAITERGPFILTR